MKSSGFHVHSGEIYQTKNNSKSKTLKRWRNCFINRTDSTESDSSCPSWHCLFKVNNRNTTATCEICRKLTIKTPERRQWRCSGVFIVNFDQTSYIVLVFSLLLWTSKYRLERMHFLITYISPFARTYWPGSFPYSWVLYTVYLITHFLIIFNDTLCNVGRNVAFFYSMFSAFPVNLHP